MTTPHRTARLVEKLSPRTFIEPLEARIAPALLVHGANLLGGAFPHTGETSVGENSATLVNVTSGIAIVWYDAAAHDITGISVGPNAALQIQGNIFGDVVANLTAAGRLSDSDNNPANGEDGGVLLANNIIGIKTSPLGPENGDIVNVITAGSISNLQIAGQIQGLYAGDGVFHAGSHALKTLPDGLGPRVHETLGVNVNPLNPAGQSGFDLFEAKAQHATAASPNGASISKVSLQTAKNLQIFAGNGFTDAGHTLAGGAGGSVSSVTIQSAFSDDSAVASYSIAGGGGGAGKTGGAGGGVSNVIEKASNGLVSIVAGAGGAGFGGAGGVGGSIAQLDVQSDSTSYTVTAGTGGAGAPAGAGGSLNNNNFSGNAPSTGIILSSDFIGNDGIADILVVDAGSGQMVLLHNTGDGTSFAPFPQGVDPVTFDPILTIQPVGSGASSAVVIDVNNDGAPDFVVAYKNSNSLGVFINDGTGVFTGSSVSLGVSPSKIVAGNFSGTSDLDVAMLVTTSGSSKIVIATGNGAGIFTPLDAETSLGFANATDLKAAQINANSLDDLFVSSKTGKISALIATGSDTAPFTVTDANSNITGNILSIDVDLDSHRLLAMLPDAKTVAVFQFDNTGALTATTGPDLTGFMTKPVLAEFVPGVGLDNIAVLSASTTASQLDVFQSNAGSYVLATTSHATVTLKNFVVVDEGADTGIAALGGSLGRFSFSQSAADFHQFALPFTGKSVNATAGDGGFGTGSGKGGAGGGISNINIEATDITLIAGHGGDTGGSGAAGAGGGIFNAATLTTASGTSIKPQLIADETLDVTAGDGGTPGGTSATAAGGNGGTIGGIILSLATGNIHLLAGAGGDGHGGAAGAGGGIMNLTTTSLNGGFSATTGSGGAATTGTAAGGGGGAFTGFTYALQLADDIEALENGYNISVTTGNGGASTGGAGGAAGAINNARLALDPANWTTNNNSTVVVTLATGTGGNGLKSGGAGGAITNVRSKSVFDEIQNGALIPNFVAMEFTAGDGGNATSGGGGVGGSIGTLNLAGITAYHPNSTPNKPALILTAGAGGNGSTSGGAGGSISAVKAPNSALSNGNVVTVNMLSGAVLTAGHGGDGGTASGGAGGGVTGVSLGVASFFGLYGGSLQIVTGDGGDGNIGGAGGMLSNGGVGSIAGDSAAVVPGSILKTLGGHAITGFGTLLATGHGGDGVKTGGAGGAISSIDISSAQQKSAAAQGIYAALLVAGHGGDASGNTGIAGAGGSISLIQSKDLNSALDLLQAGNGGQDANGTGGVGGSVTKIRTVGFIGKPVGYNPALAQFKALGVFDNLTGLAGDEVAQGIFAGRGGAGSVGKNGVAGSVSTVTARQISAIAANVDASGLFGVATAVSGITADIIGYDVNGNGVFKSSVSEPGTTPSATRPVDGFILAKAITLINTLPGHVPFEFLA